MRAASRAARRAFGRAETPWGAGRLDSRPGEAGLVFGWMYEDAAVELAALRPGGRVFAIASAGCTALALAARGDAVTAVDVNPAQVAYVAARAAGAPPRAGAVERLLGRARRLLPWVGLAEADRRAFASLEDPREQVRLWRARLDRAACRGLLALALDRRVLRGVYAAPFAQAVPPRLGAILRERWLAGIGTHPNRTNPFVWRLLLGEEAPGTAPPWGFAPARTPGRPGALHVVQADAAAFLEAGPPAAFEGFALSNVLDGAHPAYAARLAGAVRRAARPGAVVVLRSVAGAPAAAARHRQASDALARLDRSCLWGRVVAADARDRSLFQQGDSPCAIC